MEMVTKNRFSERLKELRLEAGLTRSQLAERLNVSVRLLSYWENGQRECNFDTLIALARLLNTSVDYLIGKIDF